MSLFKDLTNINISFCFLFHLNSIILMWFLLVAIFRFISSVFVNLFIFSWEYLWCEQTMCVVFFFFFFLKYFECFCFVIWKFNHNINFSHNIIADSSKRGALRWAYWEMPLLIVLPIHMTGELSTKSDKFVLPSHTMGMNVFIWHPVIHVFFANSF